MLTASIVIDLAHEPDSHDFSPDRHKIGRACLEHAPDGTRVVILVGSRRPTLDPYAIETLHEQADRLQLDIRGNDGTTIAWWHQVVRTGDRMVSV